jgi:hypothetical protein
MRKFAMSAVAVTTFAALVAMPAQAETAGGGPNQNGKQCFKYSSGSAKDGSFGYWAACPQQASTTAAAAKKPSARKNASR